MSESFFFINNEILKKTGFVLVIVGKHKECNE